MKSSIQKKRLFLLGDKDSMFVSDRKIAHQELWKKYDFSMSPLDPLPGVNPDMSL